jgi:hypothetical protein
LPTLTSRHWAKLTSDPIKALLRETDTEISSCHKLTALHLNCERAQRQNLRLAAELFSNTTSTSLLQYLPGENKNLGTDVGNFFQLVNNWFHIFNAYTPSGTVPTKKSYGLDLSNQNSILNEMKNTIGSMLCIGKRTLQIFQKGILISINSLLNLYKDMVDSLNVTYIYTHRLNQDCLEKIFPQVFIFIYIINRIQSNI